MTVPDHAAAFRGQRLAVVLGLFGLAYFLSLVLARGLS